ncbi:SEC-C metal-binding domain-containing protein [Sphingomonas sp.]|uniref:SEC-C metal-binding domain-containing protein n=1 Tax=Sphingomonas sp. TaxID=28214 RepID=UPI0035C79FE0
MRQGHVDLAPTGALASEVRDAVSTRADVIAAPRGRGMPPTTACMNVAAVAVGEGGAPRYGWMALLWPERFVELVFHAVWEQAGRYLDVTAAPHSGCGATTTLICEPRFIAPADIRLIAVAPSFMPLSPAAIDQQYFAVSMRFAGVQERLFALVEEGRAALIGDGHDGRVGVRAHDDDARTSIARLAAEQASIQEAKARLLRAMRRGRTDRVVPAPADACWCGSGAAFAACCGA